MTVTLQFQRPQGSPQEIRVERFPVRIGRSPTADVSLADRWASRWHCELDWIEGRLVVQDLNSTYGTLVNGRPVRQCALAPGDRLNVGLFTIVASYAMEREAIQVHGDEPSS